ncbi:MAG: hypothetical protein RQ736_05765 [Thiogranum sp.]|nr:hypothetical protein [Thiogranum sp.]
MEPAQNSDATVFSAWLADRGEDFLLLDDSDSEQAHLRFNGQFEGANVIWDCHFMTLASELRRTGFSSLRSFIEIGEAAEQGVPLRVGLNVACVDRPAILKMMVMIRNYKRLHRGRQEFGDCCSPDRGD